MDIKQEIVGMLNKALELEHAARIQYLAHAENVKGLYAEKIIERLRELAADEAKHEDTFCNLIGNYLDGDVTMALAQTNKADKIDDILKINLKAEKDAIDFYKQIYRKIVDNKDKFQYEFETLEHDVRHVVIDEQEHVVELTLLLG